MVILIIISFVHKGVHYVLKPMSETSIKAEVFPSSNKKKEYLELTPKPWMVLFQGRGDDEPITPQIISNNVITNYFK